jgi:hypothetical protein
MLRPVCLALATTSLLVVSRAALHAQALAPSTLHLTSPDQKTKTDAVQVITKEPAITKELAITKKPAHVIMKEPAQVIAREKSPEQKTKKDIVQAITTKPVPVVAMEKSPEQKTKRDIVRAITTKPEPVVAMEKRSETTRTVTHYSYKTRAGKEESIPVITQYYPKRIVHPFAKVDKHIDRKLMYAATIAQERAHAHSRSRCWHYVKEALLASGVINSRPQSELAKEAAQDLVNNYGFKRLPVRDPFAAPIGSVLVYGANRAAGHVEIRTRDGFVSDFCSKTPSPRPLLGVYAKL